MDGLAPKKPFSPASGYLAVRLGLCEYGRSEILSDVGFEAVQMSCLITELRVKETEKTKVGIKWTEKGTKVPTRK
jgi:hypothetical protein